MDISDPSESMFEECLLEADKILLESPDPLEMPRKFIDLVRLKEKKLSELEARIPVLEKKVREVKEKNTQVEKAREELQRELVKLTEENVLKTQELKRRNKEIRDCKHRIKKLEDKLKPSPKDEEVLETKKRELRAFHKMTGISWLFDVPDNIIAGMVTNEKTNYLKTFEFDCKKTTQAEIQAALWSYIWESRGADWSVDSKESVARKAGTN